MELRQRLEAEHAILERIARGAPLHETLEALVLLIEQQSVGIVCSLLLLDHEGGCLRHGAAPSLPPSYVEQLDGSRIGPTEGSCGAAAYSAEVVIAEDILTHPNWTSYRELASAHSLRACWSTPIFSPAREVLGTFANYYRAPRAPSREEQEWVAVATHLAAIAIVRARTSDALERAEAHARHVARINAVATSVSELFVRPTKPQELFEAVCRIAVEKGLAPLAWIGEFDATTNRLTAKSRRGTSAGGATAPALDPQMSELERSLAERAISANAPVVSDELPPDARAHGLRSCAVFPMRLAEQRLDLLAMYGDRPGFFDEEVVEILSALAKNIAFALDRERLIGELNDRVRKLSVIHAVARRLQESDRRVDGEVLQELLEALRPGLRHPSLCEARLRWKQAVAQTAEFRETAWKRVKPIGSEGALELAYREAPPDGDPFPMDEREFLRSLADMFGAYFARVTAENEVREREGQLRLASSVAKVGGWTVDLTTHVLVWSEQLFALHELPVGKSPKLRDALASCAPEFRAVAAAAFDACMREGTPFDLVLQMITATERRIWIRAIGAAELDASGNVVRVHGAIQDIDERRRLEDQLRQAQKMEAVGRVAGGIAHDFNNLLSVILSYSAYVIEGLPPDNALRSDLEQIFGAGKRASDLTRQLLTFSRQQPSSPRHLDLARVTAGIDKMLRRVVGEDVTLTVVSAAPVGVVFADRGQVEQVILNLVVNARDAVGTNGKITIELADVELDAGYAAEHHDVTAGRYVMVAVSDNGHGMDEATRAKLFEPFFTTKEKGRGTGLGLATVYGIVKQSGGHIWVYSEPRVGTTFKVYFPHSDGPVDSEPPSFAAPARGASSKGVGTILLIEDSEQVRAVASAILRRAGYSVLEAGSGDEALRIERGHDGNIDLLLTDVVLPRMGGREVASSVLARRPNLRVLYMSGYGPDAVVKHGLLDAGAAFLEKPITPDTLLRKVRETLMRGSAEAERPRRILHIDDDEGLLVLIARILRRLGYDVSGFGDPNEAVRAFEADPGKFDAVVTDIEMPGLNGFDVVRKLRAIRSDVPVVVTSGALRAHDVAVAKELGLHSLVVKPNTVEELGRALLAEIARRKS